MVLASTTTTGLAVGVSITRADTGVLVNNLLMLDPPVSSVTANITLGSNIMTVTAIGAPGGSCYDKLLVGMVLTDASTSSNLPANVYILPFGTQGTTGTGGVGTYALSANAAATATGDTVTGLWTPVAAPIAANGTTGWPTTPVGSAGTIQIFNPQMMLARAVSITSTTSQVSGATFTVQGFDVFNYPMVEVITTSGTGATTTNGKKAFKYILSVTPNTTDASGSYSVGTLDIMGFPIRSDSFSGGVEWDVWMAVNGTIISVSTGYLAAVLTTPTSSTGDVRGTYALQTPSTGTLRFVALFSPSIGNLNTGATGLYGNANYANF
jgi:hypothetical protein